MASSPYIIETFEFLTFSKFGHNKNSALQASIVQNWQLFKGLLLFGGNIPQDKVYCDINMESTYYYCNYPYLRIIKSRKYLLTSQKKGAKSFLQRTWYLVFLKKSLTNSFKSSLGITG